MPPTHLKLAIVQMAIAPSMATNRDRMVSKVGEAAGLGARVVVFPEAALSGAGSEWPREVENAVSLIANAARENRVHVLFGGSRRFPRLRREAGWLRAFGPDGAEEFRYEKLFDQPTAAMPGVFKIDGIPCSAFLCADRWLRGVEELPIQQGALVSFELSSNLASEWVESFQWYWNVPRALRNNVWVVFANSGNTVSGVSDTRQPADLHHGHSAVIAPDGAVAASASGDTEGIVVADLDLKAATRAEARRRADHAVLRSFWDAGLQLQQGRTETAPPLMTPETAATRITLAASQAHGDAAEMEAVIVQAAAQGADLIAFPARAVDFKALGQFKNAAQQNHITVVVGMVHEEKGKLRNSAFVIGADGQVLTRYDQLSALPPYQPGQDPGAMWFQLKGVPAVVTVGGDSLWTELSELAAVAGAQVHVHLQHDETGGADGALSRLQVWSNLASFKTFTATVNVDGGVIWDDLSGFEEGRAEIMGRPRPDTGTVEVYSPFSANLVVRSGEGRRLVLATREVHGVNPHFATRSRFNPQMEAWYRIGAALIHPPRHS